MNTKKSLGRGLAALIPEEDMEFLRHVARQEQPELPPRSAVGRRSRVEKQTMPSEVSEKRDSQPDVSREVADSNGTSAISRVVTLSDIVANPFQPRRTFSENELEELASSIREHGVLQPVLLRPTGVEGKYQLIAGERRWRAAQKAGLSAIPAIVRNIDDKQALELAIIENVQRHDISAIDAALAYKRLAQEFSLSQDEIAHRVGKSRSSVANTVRLLDLPPEARESIEKGAISEGHGRAILMCSTEGGRRALLRRAIRDQLSVRETERLAGAASKKSEGAGGSGATTSIGGSDSDKTSESGGETAHSDAELKDIENRLEKRLGTRISIRPKGNRGGIVISYAAPGELERIISLLLSS